MDDSVSMNTSSVSSSSNHTPTHPDLSSPSSSHLSLPKHDELDEEEEEGLEDNTAGDDKKRLDSINDSSFIDSS